MLATARLSGLIRAIAHLALPPAPDWSVPVLDVGPEGVEVLVEAAAEEDVEVFVAT